MHQYQRHSVVEQMKLSAIDRYQRNHDYLERNNHGSYHQGKEYLIQLIIRTHENISAHRGNDDDKQNADTCNTKGVHKRPGEIHLGKGFHIIGHRRAVGSDQGKRFLNNISFCLEGVDYNHNKREHINDKADDKHYHF